MISSPTLIKSTVTGLVTSPLELLLRVTLEIAVDTSNISKISSQLLSSVNPVNGSKTTINSSSAILIALNKIWVFYNIMMLSLVLKNNTLLMTTYSDCRTQLIELMKFSTLFSKNSLLEILMKKLNTLNADGTQLPTTAL